MSGGAADASLLAEPDAAFRSGADTPEAALARHLRVLDAREPEVAAFAALNVGRAQDAAAASGRRWGEGRPLSCLDGVVVGVKDVIETADMPTGQGSPIFEGHETGRDAAAVQALRQAGAVILGKTTTTEFATSHSFARTRNPHDLSRTPGGSSSGSAAGIGAGMVEAALGTQVVGSILRPASYCGVVGFKPSFGALNRGGCNDQLSQSCLGTMARSLPAAWAMASVIARHVGGDPGHPTLRGEERLPGPRAPRALAVLRTAGWAEVEPEAERAFAAELERLRGRGVTLLVQDADPDLAALEAALADAWTLTQRILAWEFRWPLASYPVERLSPAMRQRLSDGRAMSADDYAAALARRAEIRARFADLAARIDGVVALSATGAAPRIGESTGSPAMNVPASLLGVPAVSLPILSAGGLPLGLQLIGRLDGDAELMALAHWRLAS